MAFIPSPFIPSPKMHIRYAKGPTPDGSIGFNRNKFKVRQVYLILHDGRVVAQLAAVVLVVAGPDRYLGWISSNF